jgi:ligand-binding sensor domain-containing protein
VKDGEADAFMYGIYQDNGGVLWLNTPTGAYRFNGATFEKFKP